MTSFIKRRALNTSQPVPRTMNPATIAARTGLALAIATKLPEGKKRYYMAPEVGHYGIFNGRKWRDQIAPVVEKFITANS